MTSNNATPAFAQAKQQRQLKVCQACHSHQTNKLGEVSPIGQILLKGHWLKQAGFEIDTLVKVRITEGCLILTAPSQATPLPGFNQLNPREQRVITEVIQEFLVKDKN